MRAAVMNGNSAECEGLHMSNDNEWLIALAYAELCDALERVQFDPDNKLAAVIRAELVKRLRSMKPQAARP